MVSASTRASPAASSAPPTPPRWALGWTPSACRYHEGWAGNARSSAAPVLAARGVLPAAITACAKRRHPGLAQQAQRKTAGRLPSATPTNATTEVGARGDAVSGGVTDGGRLEWAQNPAADVRVWEQCAKRGVLAVAGSEYGAQRRHVQ